ncbi:MAG: plasmid pRiA4b ORF-3 family protein [Candidatus Margulisbacteria bacterium]|nr:plasmid pRiA4b ORF-3 family protein [Candidatus Margulisiibacteriota bacterium]
MNKGKIYIFKISLKNSDPLIWRRVKVPSYFTLGDFHEVIQIVMPWADCHMHVFKVKGKTYTNLEYESMENDLDEDLFELVDILKEGDTFDYIYDFGDGWRHNVKVEELVSPEKKEIYPICVEGEFAAPQENSGGLHSYYEKLEILKNKNHPEYEEISSWCEAGLDPEFFDLQDANDVLDSYK